MNHMLRRIWHPTADDVRHLRSPTYIVIVLAPAPLLGFILPLYASMLIFLGVLVLRAIVVIRGALTLPLDDLRKNDLWEIQGKRKPMKWYWALLPIFMSFPVALILPKFFCLAFTCFAVAPAFMFAHIKISISAYLSTLIGLTGFSIAVSTVQAGTGGFVAASIVALIVFPMAFETFAINNRLLVSTSAK